VPNPLLSTRGALAAEFDARQWAGSVLYTRNSGAITVTAPAGWGVFGDILDLLTGRGSGAPPAVDTTNLANRVAATTSTTVVASITPDDCISLRFTGGTSVVLAAGAGNALWGFDPAGQVSVGGGGGTQVLTAPSTWARGNQVLTAIQLTRGGSSGSAPKPGITVHSLLDSLRDWGSADADDLNPTGNLSALDFTASGGSAEVRWGVTADGHVFCSRVVSGYSDVSWVSTSFRDALGFTGLETAVVVGSHGVTTATYPCPGLLTPSRPFDTIDRGMQARFGASLASNGGAYVTAWLDRVTYGVALLLDGPADRIDRQDHMLRAVLPAMPPGARVTVYQDWGDYRRSIRTADTSNPAVAPRVAPYSLLYTSQRDGEYGRLLCRRDPGESGALVATWPDRIKRRLPVTMQVAEWEGGQ
jgi:hypothetical protein